jgi:leucyl aminopeptidase
MIITVRKGNLLEEKSDLLAVGRFADDRVGSAYSTVNERLDCLLDTVAKEDGFKATIGSTLLVRTNGAIPSKRILIVGLGDRKKFSEESVRLAAAVTLNVAKSLGAKTVASALHGTGSTGLEARVCAKAMAEGAVLADYDFSRYKGEAPAKSPKTFTILTTDGKKVRAAADGAVAGERYARATMFARDLVNTPAQHMRPADLVDAARAIAKGKGTIRVKVYGREQLERMHAGGILAVNQGSDHEPFLVHMVYQGKISRAKSQKRICLVGKAVTFDSGGLSLKPPNYMETMKCDMAGAAAVLGAFSVIDELAPGCEVHGIFGAVENMPSSKAMRPGDIVTIMNGKTIEIRNADAEGRVTLADTLVYAAKQKPDVIIDLATLTAACIISLGEEYSGLMSNNEGLAAKVAAAAKTAGENLWQLPLPDEYKEFIKSDVADYKNDAPRWGGTLTAGLLLQEFVGEIPWVHLDIAGPAFAERPLNAYSKKGATGCGTRTLLEYLRGI